MYTRYFGLHENPFALPPDPRYLYMSLRYQEALAHLMYGISQGGGFVQLTGEVGTGKTMMIRALLDRLPKEVDVALVLYPLLSVEEFVLAVSDDLGIPRPETPGTLKNGIDTLNRYLLESHARGRRTVLIIDEAHKLSHDVLEQVRLLTNLETTKEKLLQILLVGQPELTSLLAQPDLRQLAQRITARYNLTPLLPRETAEYVLQRLRVAGAQNPIFSRSALSAVHRLSRGTPRLINTLCDRALLGAYALGKNQVTGGMVRRAAAEIGHAVPRRFPYAARAAFAVASSALLAIGVWWLSEHRPVSAPLTTVAAVAAPAQPEGVQASAQKPTLAALLDDPALVLDTDTALASLFVQWRKDYYQAPGETACERAESVGLRCVYATGTWNNLRQLNRPALIELMTHDNRRGQVLVKALEGDRVTLDMAGQTHDFPLSTVDRFWYGKFFTLWRPPESGDMPLRIGVRGPAVLWLRQALARANGDPLSETASLAFDVELAEQVRAFQRRHYLEPDGVVGRNTLVYLDAYNGDVSPRLTIAQSGR